MALHVLDITVLNGVASTAPTVIQFSVGEAFLRKVHVNMESNKMGFRLSNGGLTVVPWLAAGCSPFVTLINVFYFNWEEFRRLAGPPYSLTLEVFNTDTIPHIFKLFLETAHANYYPVNVLETKENAVPKSPQAQTPNAAY